MRVALKRNLILGGQRYRADVSGVEIPDFIDGKKVVLKKDWRDGDENTIPLPQDAEIYTKPVEGIRDMMIKGKTIPPQYPVNPTQSPPPGPTPTEGSASMAIDMADAEALVDDMNNPKTKKLTTEEALEKVERDRAKAEAERIRDEDEGTVVKQADKNPQHRLPEKNDLKSPNTLSGFNKDEAKTGPLGKKL